jgi:FSR family fosmidomycin resistance protein-like MFS transporter
MHGTSRFGLQREVALARVLRENGAVAAEATGSVNHVASTRGAIWLGVAHFVVDAACVTSVLRASPPGDAQYGSALAFVLGYDLFAFAGQVPFGWLVDRLRLRRGMALAGLALSALALLAGHGTGVMLLAGAGNACFHVGAGAMVLAGSRGRAAPAGVFVAPGALGLGLGIILGREFQTAPLWPLYLAVGIASLGVLLAARRAATAAPAAPAPSSAGLALLVVGLLALSVAVRSLVGTVGCDACGRGLFLLVAIPLAGFTGKLVGGFLADRFGFIDLGMVALLASAPLLAFSGGDLWLALPGLVIFQMTMPVTLAASLLTMPSRPGLAFGALSLALVAGVLPAYLPGGWRPQGLPVLLLVLGSAAALYVALRLLLPRRAGPAASTLCGGHP